MNGESVPKIIFLKNRINKGSFGTFVFILVFLLLVIAFAVSPLPGGDDWQTFYGAAQRVINGVPLYGTKITFSFFYNPPWLAVLLVPLGLLPFRWGWSIVSMGSLVIIILLCKRWNMSVIKLFVILLSPPLFYTLLHGNIDILILGVLLLPKEYWLIAALTKPQTAIALSVAVFYTKLVKALILTSSIILLSFLIFGNWLLPFLAQPVEMIGAGHNVFRGMWPYQTIIGVIFAFFGWKLRDEKYLMGASPFFSPYAATSTMIGPLMLLISKIKDWQAIALLVIYWGGAVLLSYR